MRCVMNFTLRTFLGFSFKGRTLFTYLLRAETPGRFQARPARVELMYEPEVTGHSTPADIAVKR